MKKNSRSFFATLKYVAAGTIRLIRDADVRFLAGSLAFATVMSLVPLLAVSLSVFKAYGGFDSLFKHIEPFILSNFLEQSGAEATRAVRRAISRIHSGTLGLTGALFLLVISTKLFLDMETAIHRVWRQPISRALWQRVLVYWAVIFCGPLILAVALGVMGSKDLGLVQALPKKSIGIFVSFIALFAIYKFVPSRPVSWLGSLTSAIFATVLVGFAQGSYAVITKKVLTYNKIYGSLATIPIFLLWILLLWWITLAGAALCATIDNRHVESSRPLRRNQVL